MSQSKQEIEAMSLDAILLLPAGRELDRIVVKELGWKIMPEFSTDANAALALPHGEEVQLELELYGDIAVARYSVPTSSRSAEAFPDWQAADAPALAVLRAWLVYRLNGKWKEDK